MRPIYFALAAICLAKVSRGQEKAVEPATTENAAAKAVAPEIALTPGLKAAQEAAQKGDVAQTKKLLQAEAEKGNGDAMNLLGELLISGNGAKPAPADAAKWFSKGAEANHPRSQFNLARLLLVGAEGVPSDKEKAKFLLRQAAEGGLPDAQYALGQQFESELIGDGKGLDPDLSEPRKWYEKAAAKNHPDALLALARYADDGLGGFTKDPVKGAEFTYKAAQTGNMLAMNEMGVRYQKGLGMKAENVAAVGWFLSASELGMPAAMVNLGNCYEIGNGVPKNFNRAANYYASAARLQFAPAHYLLAGMLAEGRGVDKDPTMAFVHYTVAGKGGVVEGAKRADELKKELKSDQLKMADDILSGKIEPGGAKSAPPAKSTAKPKGK